MPETLNTRRAVFHSDIPFLGNAGNPLNDWLPFERDLLQWREHPDALAADDPGDIFVPPTQLALASAEAVLAKLKLDQRAPPTSVVPTGSGGISFHLLQGNLRTSFLISPQGQVELVILKDSLLIRRHRLDLSALCGR